MYRSQPSGPNPQRDNSRKRRRTLQHAPVAARQQHNSRRQPARARQSGPWDNSTCPPTEAMEDPNGFADSSYEYPAAESSATCFQFQHPTSPISNDISQILDDTQHQAVDLNNLEQKVDHLSAVLKRFHHFVIEKAAEPQSHVSTDPQPEHNGWNVNEEWDVGGNGAATFE
ncbi:hypothetical protein CSUB01_09607 [Colletotrichum sublineola]|uniref:Uncharacterized protein n=1 Tax=Colletotrichum sublineola TaxID=1173701 RepID=A0A066XW09_COLSU|nr:hypothetical protein CSUB01_09607 [Colletotrichum sublineola]